jgi:hypothetical protein
VDERFRPASEEEISSVRDSLGLGEDPYLLSLSSLEPRIGSVGSHTKSRRPRRREMRGMMKIESSDISMRFAKVQGWAQAHRNRASNLRVFV